MNVIANGVKQSHKLITYVIASGFALAMTVQAQESPFKTGTPEDQVTYIDYLVKNKITDKTAISPMVAALNDPESAVPVKEHAAWALGELGLKSEVDSLVKAVGNKGLLVRSAALNSLFKMRARTGFDAYVNIAKSDPILALRKKATLALGILQWDKAINPLVALAGDERPEIRAAATLAMSLLHTEKNNFIEALTQMSQDADPMVQEMAEVGLDMARRKNQTVRKYLTHENSDVRTMTAVYFHANGKAADLQAVKDASDADASEDVRYFLKEAAKGMEKRVAEQKKAAAKAKAAKAKATTTPAGK